MYAHICHRVPGLSAHAVPMTSAPQRAPQRAPQLSTARGAALYIGALLGPSLLLLPGLAAELAGPASILAWLGLLAVSGLLAVLFTALGTRLPSGGGVAGSAAAGLPGWPPAPCCSPW